nr:serine/threonine protein phosphatase [Bacteroidota bacterium]
MNKWIIPDLHGCSKTLKALIEELIKPEHGDSISFLGDYIDRGPDAKGTIDYVWLLQQNGYNIHALKGNHEEYLLLAYEEALNGKKKFFRFRKNNRLFKEWVRHGGNDTLQSFGVKRVDQIPENYIRWFQNLENYYEDDGYVIVHAGLNFNRRNPFEDHHAMLWSRSFDVIPEKIGNKKIIHGHVPVSLDFIKACIVDPHQHYIPLDNGCYLPGKVGMGNLV